MRPSVVPLLLAVGCVTPPDRLLEEPRGDVAFEAPRRLPEERDLPTSLTPPTDPRAADSVRVRAIGRADGSVLFLRIDREPPTTVARITLGEVAVTALAFGSDAAARYLYVTQADGRLRTVDVEAAEGPAVVDTIRTRGALALAADGDRLVLLTDEPRRRILRFDLWNPARPRLDGAMEVGAAEHVGLQQDRLVLFGPDGAARAYRLAGGVAPPAETGTTTVHQSVNQ